MGFSEPYTAPEVHKSGWHVYMGWNREDALSDYKEKYGRIPERINQDHNGWLWLGWIDHLIAVLE